jgi:GNAT superfamily N-acetyltransferase
MPVTIRPAEIRDVIAMAVAVEGETIGGAVAGHRTRRYGCAGELQWINVTGERRRHGIAGLLLVKMAGWFVEQSALRVCVNVEPANAVARELYEKYCARTFHECWMVGKTSARSPGVRDRLIAGRKIPYKYAD